jgi:hypothetical protein
MNRFPRFLFTRGPGGKVEKMLRKNKKPGCFSAIRALSGLVGVGSM